MGTYVVEVTELVERIHEFLHNIEGEVSAVNLAEAWNLLAERYEWDDRLKSYSGVEGD